MYDIFTQNKKNLYNILRYVCKLVFSIKQKKNSASWLGLWYLYVPQTILRLGCGILGPKICMGDGTLILILSSMLTYLSISKTMFEKYAILYSDLHEEKR